MASLVKELDSDQTNGMKCENGAQINEHKKR